jgi:uncharacterized membrane protein YphA (DoxX/SURF4 family)
MAPDFLIQAAKPDFYGPLLRAVICGGYLWSGIAKLMHFNGATREFSGRYKFRFPKTMLIMNIITVIVGSIMVILGWELWLGASALGVFTLVATWIGYPFWRLQGRERMEQMFTFLEHVSLVGAFLLIAWQDLHR